MQLDLTIRVNLTEAPTYDPTSWVADQLRAIAREVSLGHTAGRERAVDWEVSANAWPVTNIEKYAELVDRGWVGA